jgi:hypothetical protein
MWCASWRLCAGSASTHANVPALTAFINSKPNRNPPTVAAKHKRVDAKRGTDLPDEFLAGGRATHAGKHRRASR